MIEIAICDDNSADLNTISKMVCEICLNEVIDYHLKTYSSGEEMLDQTYSLDIGILDVLIRDWNGIDLGKELKKRFPEAKLIYITRQEQYCQQVINQVHAFSFFTKPVLYENLRDQIIEVLDDMEEDASGRKRKFYHAMTSDKREIEVLTLNLKDILYFEYIKSERKIKIVCKNDFYEISYVMEKLANELRKFGFEVNCRGMLVNMGYVRKVKGYSLLMDNGQELVLAQKRKADFMKRWNEFMHRDSS